MSWSREFYRIRQQVAPASQEQQEVRAASAGLGLAILAGFCRVPELAASQEIIQTVPLLLKACAIGPQSSLLRLSGNYPDASDETLQA
jgi:Neurochondrin